MANTEKIKKIVWNIIVPVVLVAALIVLGFWGARQRSLAATYEGNTRNMYQRCYYDLADNVNNMSVILEKIPVVNSPTQYVLLLDDLWRLSGSSEGLLSQLPTSHVDTQAMNRFIVQTGDFARALTKRVLSGGLISDEDMQQLEALQESAKATSATLQERIQSGDMPAVALSQDEYYTASDEKGESNSTNETSQSTQEFPTLIYDGPFADSVQKAEPKGLSGDEVSQEQAQQAAEQLFPGSQYQGESNGIIPSYEFYATLEGDRGVDISITKVGAKILSFVSYFTSDVEGTGDEQETKQLKEAALARLSELGFGDMYATYAQYYDGCAVINCAAMQDDVILYNDLVKVWVDRSSKQVVGLDARNYWMSHTERDLKKDQIVSEEDAKGMVSSNLKIESTKLALIPLTINTERLCYEFKGTYKDSSYIVYINANTLAEEQVFKIIDSENGQLVL